MPFFKDRREAGRILASKLTESTFDDALSNVLVLALPRGGVPVAYEVAQHFRIPLDVFIVRKLGVPGAEELAMGAIASGNTIVYNEPVMHGLKIPEAMIKQVIEHERHEMKRREKLYRQGKSRLNIENRVIIIVDDGLATGSTMLVAIQAIRKQNPKKIIVAVPISPPETCRALEEYADKVICVETPQPFYGVGAWYRDFSQTTDHEVQQLLMAANRGFVEALSQRSVANDKDGIIANQIVAIPAGSTMLEGRLDIPNDAVGMVLFAHGSGSSRHSKRNIYVAEQLQTMGLGTLLMDLLTHEEEVVDNRTRHLRFNIDLLAQRLGAALEWLARRPETRHLPIGVFGASTGAGAALVAVAMHPEYVSAVVSRGGRPDLAGPVLTQVQAPTLLIVGGQDHPVIELNTQAMAQMRCAHKLEIIPNATHLFVEPGALTEVAELASRWFVEHLVQAK